MTRVYFLLAAFLFPLICLSQAKRNAKFIADKEWKPGTIALANGENLSGEVKFNDKTGLLSFRGQDDELTFTPNTVNRFTFQQNDTLTREFYSLMIQEYEQPREQPAFFEVLRQFKDFALLSRPLRAETKQRRMYSPTPGVGGTAPTPGWVNTYEYVGQDEVLYFVDNVGKVTPYVKVTYESDSRKPRAEMLNEYLLKVYTSPYYPSVQKFMKEKKLKVKRREDLLRVLDHYAQLVAGEN